MLGQWLGKNKNGCNRKTLNGLLFAFWYPLVQYFCLCFSIKMEFSTECVLEVNLSRPCHLTTWKIKQNENHLWKETPTTKGKERISGIKLVVVFQVNGQGMKILSSIISYSPAWMNNQTRWNSKGTSWFQLSGKVMGKDIRISNQRSVQCNLISSPSFPLFFHCLCREGPTVVPRLPPLQCWDCRPVVPHLTIFQCITGIQETRNYKTSPLENSLKCQKQLWNQTSFSCLNVYIYWIPHFTHNV